MKLVLQSNRGAELPFEYDPVTDVLTIDGTKYSAEIFRAFGTGLKAFEIGARVELVQREDGSLTLRRL